MIERKIRDHTPINAVAAQKLKTAVEQETAGKFESAMVSLDEALLIQEKYPDAWLIKGVILTKQGKCNDALKCYDKALEINAGFVDALRLKSATYTSLGSHNKALECLSAAVELEPENLDLRLIPSRCTPAVKTIRRCFPMLPRSKAPKAKRP